MHLRLQWLYDFRHTDFPCKVTWQAFCVELIVTFDLENGSAVFNRKVVSMWYGNKICVLHWGLLVWNVGSDLFRMGSKRLEFKITAVFYGCSDHTFGSVRYWKYCLLTVVIINYHTDNTVIFRKFFRSSIVQPEGYIYCLIYTASRLVVRS